MEKSKAASDSNVESTQDRKVTDATQPDSSRPSSPSVLNSLYDKDLLRMFAEVNFIQGEVMFAFVCYVRSAPAVALIVLIVSF